MANKMINITTGTWKWDENGIQNEVADYFLTESAGRRNAKSITMETAKMYWEKSNLLKIKKVIFNHPATIIIWNDNSKTVVKLIDGDTWDPEKGFAMAYLKKILGTQRLKKEIKTWVKPQEELEKDDGLDLVEAVKDYIAKAFNAKKEDK